ncbi:telomerase Cajal body protein 1 [Procambarus clarkii]|uniref:telomerase Cajal body protein 1 n=1 Tax=Procambarus clarkii TaxID=6728 RepID=UPI003743B1C5
MDEEAVINKEEFTIDDESNSYLNQQKLLVLAQLDAALILPPNPYTEICTNDKSIIKHSSVDVKTNSRPDSASNHKGELGNITNSLDTMLLSISIGQDTQKSEETLSNLTAAEMNVSKCTRQYDNGLCEVSVTDSKCEVAIQHDKESCKTNVSLNNYEGKIQHEKGPCNVNVSINNHEGTIEFDEGASEVNKTVSDQEGTIAHTKGPSEASGQDTEMDAARQEQNNYWPALKFTFDSPVMALDYKEEYSAPNVNFTKGCKWSPDGSCLLVGSDDCKLRLLNLPAPVVQREFQSESWFMEESKKYAKAAITVQERELIYDFAWFPLMQSNDPRTCCFAVTCRDQPVHLWDAWNGNLICSYHSYDHLDQLVAAYSVGFSEDGSQLVCGFSKCLRVFHTSRPGRHFESIDAKGQPGIISCMAFNPQLPSVFAAGSYLGTLGLYNLQSNSLFCRLEGCQGGVTHIQFSADGTQLFSGTRKNDEILCWDIRNLGQILCAYRRKVSTNQRMYFDLEPQLNSFLVSGNTEGQVLKWDLGQSNEGTSTYEDIPMLLPSSAFTAHKDCTNGISIHPYYPILATSSGQRHFPEPVSECDSDSSSESEVPKQLFTWKKIVHECSVKLWWLGGL